jgi:IS30 family transposase
VSLLKSRERVLTKDAIVNALKGQQVLSLSLDNGSEFAAFKQIEKELNTIVYFADPHSPWQRGSNENINGLLRFFFPKGTNFLGVTQEELDHVITLINNRPRKCLGWLSPIEFLNKCCI